MKSQRGNSGMSIFGLLGVIFIVLKILDVAPVGAWSWWLVTAPLWAGFVLVMLIAGFIAVIAAIE